MDNCNYYITSDGRFFKTTSDAANAMDSELMALRESKADYDSVISLLKKRFPPRADGTHPDWKIEDVLKENAEVRLLAVDFAQYNDRVDSSPAPLLLKAIRRRDDAAQRLRMEITNLKRELEVAKAELALWKSNYESAKARADYLQSDVGKVPTKGTP